jgi:hypothetical protein
MIISANYPDRLDKALIRPGRIDVKIAFERADRGFIAEMMTGLYKRSIAVEDVPADLAHCFTPAEVTEACCRFYKSAEGAIGYLVGKAAAVAAEASSGEGTPLEDIIGMRIEEIPVAPFAPAALVASVVPAVSVAPVVPADSVVPAEQPVVDDRPIISRAVEERSILAAQTTTDALVVEPKEVPVKIPTLCQSEEFYNILLANRRQYEDVIDTVSFKMDQAEKEWYGTTDSDIASAKFEEPDTSGWGPLSP